MNTITLSKRNIVKADGVVVLPIKKYKELVANSIPTYYLTGRKALALDKLVTRGLKDYKEGRTIRAESLGEALHAYGKGRKH